MCTKFFTLFIEWRTLGKLKNILFTSNEKNNLMLILSKIILYYAINYNLEVIQ